MKLSIKLMAYNKFFFKNNYIFFKKLFNMFIKNGLKIKVLNMFYYYINLIVIKFLNLNKKLVVNIYLNQIMKKILPVVNNDLFFIKGDKINAPRLFFNKKINYRKLNSLSCLWIKKSVYARKEKTLFLKILSELEAIRNKKSNSLNLKKDFYRAFYKNRHFIKFLKKKNWI